MILQEHKNNTHLLDHSSLPKFTKNMQRANFQNCQNARSLQNCNLYNLPLQIGSCSKCSFMEKSNKNDVVIIVELLGNYFAKLQHSIGTTSFQWDVLTPFLSVTICRTLLFIYLRKFLPLLMYTEQHVVKRQGSISSHSKIRLHY